VIQAVVSDLRAGVSQGRIAARFHNGLANLALEICTFLSRWRALSFVALSGGVWQNRTLLELTLQKFRTVDFLDDVFIHRKLPPNDGCIALGQVMIAAHQKK
jgi:hydrogenase maturation protein HypF